MIKRVYDSGRNLYNEFLEKREKIDKRYVVPFLLKLTDKVELYLKPEYIQVKDGDSGGKR
jgi:hypothetical protein